jgi:hypothetical protein
MLEIRPSSECPALFDADMQAFQDAFDAGRRSAIIESRLCGPRKPVWEQAGFGEWVTVMLLDQNVACLHERVAV